MKCKIAPRIAAAICSALAISSGSTGAPVHQIQITAPELPASGALKAYTLQRSYMDDLLLQNLSSAATPISHHPASWTKKNQRQIRLARRRAHAAGKKHAFA